MKHTGRTMPRRAPRSITPYPPDAVATLYKFGTLADRSGLLGDWHVDVWDAHGRHVEGYMAGRQQCLAFAAQCGVTPDRIYETRPLLTITRQRPTRNRDAT